MKQEKRRVTRSTYKSNKEVNDHLGRRMNEDVCGKRKLFRNEVGRLNGTKGKVGIK